MGPLQPCLAMPLRLEFHRTSLYSQFVHSASKLLQCCVSDIANSPIEDVFVVGVMVDS